MFLKYVHFIELFLNKSIFKMHVEEAERDTQFDSVQAYTLPFWYANSLNGAI